MTPDNSWDNHRRLVEFRLDQNEQEHKKLEKKLNEIHDSIITLKVKSGIWGAASGAIPAIAALMYTLLR